MIWAWGGFILFILTMLVVDLGVFNRKHHVVSMREALVWFGVWMGLAVLFNIGLILLHPRGLEAGLEFITGFLVEKSLSIDNVFVFILIFNYFQILPAYQHKVLSLGILGAILLRVTFILGGLALIERFHWTLYLFGAFLLFTGTLMLVRKESEYDPGSNWAIRILRRFIPISETGDNGRFFVRIGGRVLTTPLFIALIAIESSDILFAADSIPASFAVTTDPFIVFTSNIFAMLGLRALYFAVQGFMKMYHFLHYGFALIIIVLGIKMVLNDVYKLPISVSLLVIVLILLMSVTMSLLRPRRADLKQLFERTERLGLIPFRRLLLIENIVDIGDMKVRDSMRQRSEVRVIRLDSSWKDNLETMGQSHFSRYPMIERVGEPPIAIIHSKSIFLSGKHEPIDMDFIRSLSRPVLSLSEDLSLEEALSVFQGSFDRLAVVTNEIGEWTGILTFEDLIQEIVGSMGDEFDQARGGYLISLADALNSDRIFLDLDSASMKDAIREMVDRIPDSQLPSSRDTIIRLLLERKQMRPFYMGDGVAVLHARFPGKGNAILAFARSDLGIPIEGTTDRAQLLFLLLTPSTKPRLQTRVLAIIDGLFKSQYVSERLRNAQSAEAVIEAVSAGQQVPIA